MAAMEPVCDLPQRYQIAYEMIVSPRPWSADHDSDEGVVRCGQVHFAWFAMRSDGLAFWQ